MANTLPTSQNNRPTSSTVVSGNLYLASCFGLCGVAIFGATLPATRFALESFDPVFLTFGRACGARLLAIAALLIGRQTFPRLWAKRIFISGLGTVFGFPLFSSLAMQTVPVSHGGVVLGILPLCTAIAGVMVGKERPSALFWLLAIVGASVVVFFAIKDSGFQIVTGDIWLFCAAISVAFGYAINGVVSRSIPGWAVICWSLILTLPISLMGAFLSFGSNSWPAETSALLAFAYVTCFSMFIGFFFWNTALAMGGVSRIGQIQLLQPFFTLTIAWLLVGEDVSGETWLYALIVVALVATAQKARVKQAAN